MNNTVKEILFIDANVIDKQTLIAGVAPNVKVVELNDKFNVFDQMVAALKGQKNLDAIHIISHGSEGELNFSSGAINNSNLSTYSKQLKKIGASLSKDGDILLYGCDVAKGDDGKAFINSIAKLTKADVAASIDATGASWLGGDWILEAHQGDIETSNLMISAFDNLLTAPYTGVITFSNAGGSIDDAGDTGYAGNINSASYSVGGYALTATVDQHGVAIENGGYSSGISLTAGTYNGSGVTTGTLAFSNGETFNISSLGMYNYTHDSAQNFRTYVIKGYNGATLVGTVEDTAPVNQSYKTFNLNFTSVTRVEITAKNDGFQDPTQDLTPLGKTSYYYIDNIDVANVGAVADTTPPTFDVAPATSNVTTTTLDLSAGIDEAGTIYYVVVPNNASAPSVAQVLAGQDSTGAAALKSGNSVVSTTPFTSSFSSITGLTASTDYDVYVVAKDTALNPMAAVTKLDVATTGASVIFDFETAAGDGTSTVTQTVSGVTMTVTMAAGGGEQWYAGAGSGIAGTSGNVLVDMVSHTSETFSFSSAVDLTSFRLADQGIHNALVFTPTGGSNSVVNVTETSAGATVLLNWTGVTSFTVTKSGGGVIYDVVYDNFIFTVADTTPPTFDVAPATSNVTSTTLNLSASIDESGTIYYVVVPNNASAPSVAQVLAGQDSTGAAALKSGNSAVTTTPFTSSFSSITGLNGNTNYDIYVVAQDAAGTPNVMATVTKVDVATLNAVPEISDLNGDISTFYFGDVPVWLDAADGSLTQATQVIDTDSTNFDTGKLTITYAAGADSTLNNGSFSLDTSWGITSGVDTNNDDTLNSGDTSDSVITAGEKIYYDDGVVGHPIKAIGTVGDANHDGQNGKPLWITFNSNAIPDVVGTVGLLLQAVSYTAPSLEGGRIFDVTVSDGDGGTSAVSTVTMTGVDQTPPTFDVVPATANVLKNTFDLSTSLDEAGTIYYVVVQNNAATPSVAQVLAGQNSTSAAALKSGSSVVSTTPFTSSFSSVTGLTATTDYDIYVVAKDAAGTPNVMTSVTKVDVKTAANAAPTAISPTTGTVSTFDSANATAATLSVTDADDTVWTFSIQSITLNGNAQTNDGSLFNLVSSGSVASNTLQATTPSTLPTGSYTVVVRATDSDGLYRDEPMTVSVSNSLIVTINLDSGDDATIGVSYSADLADGGGLSLREALNYVSDNGTIGFASGLSGNTIALGSNATVKAGVVFDADAVGTLTISGNTLNLSGSLTSSNGTGDTLTISSILAGASNSLLTKIGSGTLSLVNASNSTNFLGSTTVNGGTLSLGLGGVTPVNGATSLGAARLTLDGGTMTALGSGQQVITSDFTIGSSGGTVSAATNNIKLSGQITANSGVTLTKSGGTVLTLTNTSNSSTFAGNLVISAGTIEIGDSSAGISAGQLNTGTITLGSGTTLQLPTLTPAGSIEVANAVMLTGNATLQSSSNTMTVSGQITGGFAVTKLGSGTLILSGTNSYGSTTVSSGTLSIGADSNLGTATVTLNGGTAKFLLTNDATVDNAISLGSSGGSVQVDSGTGTLSGVVSSTGAFTKLGAGTLVLSGANTYSGATTVSVGTLVVASNTALGTTAGTTTVASGATVGVQGSITVSEPISLNGGGSAGAGALVNLSGNNTLSGAITLTGDINLGVASDSLVINGVISGAHYLNKVGAGTLTVSGANTYSGTTTVSAGTLSVTGSLANTLSMTVNSGATLGGTGSIFAPSSTNVTIVSSGGTLSSGVSGAGTLTVNGNLTLSSGSILAVDINGAIAGTGYDQIVVRGSVDVTGASLSSTLGYSQGQGDSYTLIDNDGADAISGGFSSLSEGGTTTVNSVALTASYIGGSGNDFTLTAPTNAAPVISNLNADSVAWAGIGQTVLLDASTSVTVSDTELGNNWNGASLTVQRSNAALASDVFSIDATGQNFTINGNNLQSGSQTFATFTNANGVLTVTFNNAQTTATTALVQEVIHSIFYRNDTPTGDTTIRFALLDGAGAATNADVTVESDTIYVTNATDTSTIDVSNGVSFGEAIAIASADITGTQTLVIDSNLASQTVSVSSNPIISESVTLNGDVASGAILSSGTVTINQNYILTVTNEANNTLELSGVFAGAGALLKNGAGKFTLSGTNTHIGTTTVSAGTLALDNGSAVVNTNAITVNSGATLQLVDSETIGSLVGAGNVVLSANTLTTGGNNTSTAFSGVISGTGSLEKTGNGTFTLSGSNTYGTTTVSAGTLSIASDSNLGSGLVILATTLEITGATTIDNAITLNSNAIVATSTDVTLSGVIDDGASTYNLTKTGAGTLTLSGTNSYAGTTVISSGILAVSTDANLGGDYVQVGGLSNGVLELTESSEFNNVIMVAAPNGEVMVDSGKTVTLSGKLDEDPNGNLNDLYKTGGGILILSSPDNEFGLSGDIFVMNGEVQVANDDALPNGEIYLAEGKDIELTGDTAINNNLNLNGDANVDTGNHAVTISGEIKGGAGNDFTKKGTGTLTLSGANSFSGATILNSGTLLLNGSMANTANVSVGTGATLGGSGTIGTEGNAGAVSIGAGGKLSPGNSPGIITLNNGLTLATGATLDIQINNATVGTGYDQVVVKGAVNVTNATLNLSPVANLALGSVFKIIDNDGTDAVVGTFSGAAQNSLLSSNGNYFRINYQGGDGNDVTLTADVLPPPPIPATPTIALAADSGSSSTDAITKNGTVNVAGLVTGATWQYSTDGSNWLSGSGSSFNVTGDGAKTISVRQTSSTGTSNNATLNFTLDSTSPTAATVKLATDSGKATDFITNDGTITVSGIENNAVWEYSTDAKTWTVGTAKSLKMTGDGSQSIAVRQTDVAGNTSTETLNFTLDTEVKAPSISLSTDSGQANDNITNNGTINIADLESNATWEYSTDGTAWTTGTGSSVKLTGDGVKSIIVRQTDVAGNISAISNALGFTLDTTVAIPTLQLATTAKDNVTKDGTVKVSGLETGASWEYSLDGTTWVKGTGDSFTVTGDGLKSVFVRQTDAAANTATSEALNFTIRTKATTPTLALMNDSGNAGDNVTNDGTVNVSGLETAATWEFSEDGKTWTAGTGNSFQVSDDGQKSVYVRQTDVVGNTATSDSLGFTLDTIVTVPMLMFANDSDVVGDKITNDGTVRVSGLETGATWEYSVDGQNWTMGTGESFSVAEDAEKSVFVRQTDAAGNQKTSEPLNFTLKTKVENSAPVFTSAATFELPEKTTAITTITATDKDGDLLNYSLAGGTNQDLFTLDSVTGNLAFKTPVLFDTKPNSTNSYNVSVSVSDGKISDTQNLTITVLPDLDGDGKVDKFDDDIDGDGILNIAENNIPNPDGKGLGDANADGISDELQANVGAIKTIATDKSGSPRYAALSVAEGLIIQNITNTTAKGLSKGQTLPLGSFGFTVGNVPVGQTVTITLTVSPDVVMNDYLKQDKTTGKWKSITPSAVMGGDATKKTISFSITDGDKVFDKDGVADGKIVDPGGPAVTANAPVMAQLASSTATLAETNDILSASGVLTSTNSANFTMVEKTIKGLFGSLTVDKAGSWTYTADAAHNEFLKDQVYADTFDVQTTDGWKTSVVINITGTKDAPLIIDDAAQQVLVQAEIANITQNILNGHLILQSEKGETLEQNTDKSWTDLDKLPVKFTFGTGKVVEGIYEKVTLSNGSSLKLNTLDGSYTYTPNTSANVLDSSDKFTVSANGGSLELNFNRLDLLDRDGIPDNIETQLADLANASKDAVAGDLNGDGIEDKLQGAVANIAWITNKDFRDGLNNNLTSSKPIIGIVVTSDNAGTVDSSSQLSNVSVLPSNSSIGKPKTTATIQTPWDPLQFSIASTTNKGLKDADPNREGTQTLVKMDISRSGETAFNGYMKYVSAATINVYKKAGIPLVTLDGEKLSTAKQAGWYDFTQRISGGDGAHFLKDTSGKITDIEIVITDNQFGDDDIASNQITDPSLPVIRALPIAKTLESSTDVSGLVTEFTNLTLQETLIDKTVTTTQLVDNPLACLPEWTLKLLNIPLKINQDVTTTIQVVAPLNGTGNALANQMVGNSADNILNGLAGADTLTGGLGADTFVFGDKDVIADFNMTQGDKIDVKAIGATSLVATFTKQVGQLRFDSATQTLQADMTGDGNADATLQLLGVTSFSANAIITK